MPDVTEDVRRIAAGQPGVRSQIKRLISRMLNRHALAQRVFIGDDGKVTPAAMEWLGDLARNNFVEATTYTGDREQMLINEGRRRLALEIIQSVRLDTDRLEALKNAERETSHD